MDPQAPATGTTARSAAEPSQSQPSQPPSSLPPPSSSTPPISAPPHPSPNPNPNPSPIQNPNSKPPIATPPQPRPPPSFNRNLPPPSQQQQSQSHFQHMSSLPPSSAPPASSFPSTPSSSISGATAGPRGGVAIGVPAHHQSPSPPFSSSFGQHFGGLGRTGVNVTESTSNSSTSQVRTPMQGMGMLGSLGSSSQMRPGGIPAHQQRPVQSSLRPPSSVPNNQPAGSQSFQGHGLMRSSSVGVGSPASPSPSASQSMQSLNQPWLSAGPQGKPPLPSPSYRQQLNPQSLQQRSHISQQQQPPTPTASQQQQPLPSNQSQEHFGQQVPSSRALHMPHQQQVTRLQGSGNQKPSSLMVAQSSAVQPGIPSRLVNADTEESCNSILSKRSIHELVNQVDPLEKLDPAVADILVDIAENFLETITRSGCSLAKHRKSTTLEAKDILLHLEKNWNMTLPGFGGDEIKGFKRQLTCDIHKERLAAIKKSMITTEAAHTKGSAGQASGSAKGSQAKTSLNVIGSPNLKNS
ncbi:transcription initiation factor TFIID subunit 12 isoform X1 [Gastrolobium bilobum]|uniref:transcription initiation factor TFIID subunit 12 isoform X1 n=1 Tax=Gastrolobium bilobum TaxID=150636 RepID=UPI002AB1D00B|nr:transcription initiation factor TFIID subunit 12 isoform X1 [Gastrolobium bilobum]XP_061357038.1 transcription initiation factor TFIID subunit 12 isoform X1 [Gastrolobium bilobum]